MTYPPTPRNQFAGLAPAEEIARAYHDAYERRCWNQYGYNPRPWSNLTNADQQMKIAAAQEMLDREIVMVLPNCAHEETTLRRIEVRQCDRCGSYPRLYRQQTQHLAWVEQARV